MTDAMTPDIPADLTRERGSALIMVLLFLAMMSILGIAAMRGSSLEEKMSGNSYDRAIALEAAEAALRDGELDVLRNLSTASPFDAACAAGLCLPATTPTPQWRAVNWNGANVREYGVASTEGAYTVPVARAPRYIVELLPDMPPGVGRTLGIGMRNSTGGGTPYRITAVGWGRRASTQVMLQSVFVKS